MDAGRQPGKDLKRRKMILVWLGSAVGILLIGYLVLCATVCRGVMFPNTYISGQDVSGMTQQEAQQEAQRGVTDTFADGYTAKKMTVAAEGKEYTISLAGILDLDSADAVQEAYARGHSDFFSRGMVWMLSHLKSQSKNVLPGLVAGSGLSDRIEASGLLAVDTGTADTYRVSGNKITFTKGTSGEVPDEEALKERISKALEKGDYGTTIECPMKQAEPKALDLDQVYDDVVTKPVNATLDPKKNYAVVDAVQGKQFDKKKAQKAIANLKEGESTSLKLVLTDAEITTNDLKEKLFRDKLGSYSTKVSGTAARLSNVRLAAQHCNGTILLSGDVFSYNKTVGERTAARGFRKACAYLNGVTIQELGGGVCQVSSTLYSATVFSNLEIVQRTNHSFESTYIPLGMDATVSWGGPDYQCKNNTDYPVKVVTSYSGGVLTCQLWGTKTDDVTVKFTHKVLETMPYGTVRENDTSMAVGTSVVSQTGETGYKVQSYRELYDASGKLISKTKEAYSVYTKRNEVIKVGAKAAEKKTDKKKSDEKKSDETKSGEKKSDEAKSDEKKSDETKTDEKKTDETKSDTNKTDATKSDQEKTA